MKDVDLHQLMQTAARADGRSLKVDTHMRLEVPSGRTTGAPPVIPDWLRAPVGLGDLDELVRQPVDFVIQDLLQASSASLLSGVGGAGKSTWLKQLAASVASGLPFCGRNITRPGHAVLVLAEDTVDDVQRSFHAILAGLDLPTELKAKTINRLHVFAAAGQDAAFLTPTGTQDGLAEPLDERGGQVHDRLTEFIKLCRAIGDVRLVGLDPVIALSRGRELDEIGQRKVAQAVERIALSTGAAVVLVTHSAKSFQYQDQVGSHNARGSGAMTDAVRLEMILRSMTCGEARSCGVREHDRHRFVRFQVTKANRLPPDAMRPVWLERGSGGVLQPAQLGGSPVGEGSVSPRESSAMMLLQGAHPVTGDVQPAVLRFADWLSAAVRQQVVTGTTPAAQDMSGRRLLKALLSKGLVASPSSGQWTLTGAGLEFLMAKSRARLPEGGDYQHDVGDMTEGAYLRRGR